MHKSNWLGGFIIGAALLVQNVQFVPDVHADPAAVRQFVDGAVMAEQIRAKLGAEGFSPVTQFVVDASDDGEVMIKGVAASDAEVARAVELAKQTSGVVGVRSEIIVKRLQ